MRNLRIPFMTICTAALLSLSATTASAQVCASLNLTTQAQVDAVNCTSVTGTVEINGANILNLAGLSDITSVGGDLRILSNHALTSLNGLGGITSVGGFLWISHNGALTNLDGLGAEPVNANETLDCLI